MSVAGAGANGDVSRPSLPAQQPLLFPRPSLSLPHNAEAKLQAPAQEIAWNSSNLGLRLAADASAAGTASILVSPIISVIDRYDAPHTSLTPPTHNQLTDNHSALLLQKPQPAPASQPASETPSFPPSHAPTPSSHPNPSYSSFPSTSAPTSPPTVSIPSLQQSSLARPIAFLPAL
jgi:hypothetical protein